MKFGIIDTEARSMTRWECADLEEAKMLARMNKNVDFGTILPVPSPDGVGISIVVYEFGLYAPVDQIKYFSINKRLFAGNAVLYGYDYEGCTVDLPQTPLEIEYYENFEAVTRGVSRGVVVQPSISVNGVVKWRWPQPGPESTMKLVRERDGYKL
jgi:hypothetical protein